MDSNHTGAKSPAKKRGGRSARRRSREFALQGVYQWLMSHTDPEAIDAAALEAEDFEVSKNDPNYTSIDGNIYTKDGKTLVRVATLKKNVRIADGCENICTSAFLYTPLGLNWEAKLRKHIDNLFIPKTVKNIDEKSYITYESEPEKITSEERAKVQKGAVTINNIQIENKNFDVNILSKLLDKVTCNKDEVLKQLTAK